MQNGFFFTQKIFVEKPMKHYFNVEKITGKFVKLIHKISREIT
jgi:hypothetical protein